MPPSLIVDDASLALNEVSGCFKLVLNNNKLSLRNYFVHLTWTSLDKNYVNLIIKKQLTLVDDKAS